MGQYEFTYEVPDNFHSRLVRFLQQNGSSDLAQMIQPCKIDYEDMGLAYYAGLKGDNWDKKALDFVFEGTKSCIDSIRPMCHVLKDAIRKLLKPTKSGYLVRNIEFIISDDGFELSLPDEQDESFEVLSKDIHDALGKNEPALVLDRLHTYSVKLLRRICRKHGIPVSDDSGNYYSLHSLAGALAKFYRDNRIFESDFVDQALRMSISTFEKYNEIRNTKSYAHDNVVLSNAESTYAVTIVAATLDLIHKLEQ